MLKFKRNDNRLIREYLHEIDPRLAAVLWELANYAQRNFKYDITVTCLNRTVEENTAVGGSPTSAHLDNRAADIRCNDIPVDIAEDLIKHLKTVWGEDFLFVLRHGKGANVHIHVNINYKHRRN